MQRFTVSGTLIPFDDKGNELCLLYLKYGRCRYRKKCKKSHSAWFPPLPDEEPPRNPPLPSAPPPYSPEEQHPALEDFHQKSFLPITLHSELESLLKGQNKPLTEGALTSSDDYKLNETQRSDSLSAIEKQVIDCENSVNTCASNQSLMKTPVPDVSLIHNNEEVDDNEHTSGPVAKTSMREEDIIMETNAEKLERIYRKLSKGNSHFGHVFKTQSSKYQSGVDKMFQDTGAYFNRHSNKLEVKKSPVNKVEKHYLKLMKRIHWKINQSLHHKLAEIPPVYRLNVDLTKVNFTRLKPYTYLLVHECFSAGNLKPISRLPSSFTVLVSDTLLAQFEHKNLLPLEAEKKLCSWGAGSVMVRKCIKELWSTVNRSSVSSAGAAAEVLRCESGVRERNLRFLDYAFACSLATSKAKSGVIERELKHINVSRSVRQGLKSIKDKQVSICGGGQRGRLHAPHLSETQKRTLINLPKLRAAKQHLSSKEDSITCDLSKETFTTSSTKPIPVMDSSICKTTKQIRCKLNNSKRKELDIVNEPEVTPRQKKRKRSRQFKGTSKEEKQKMEAKFRKILKLQFPDTAAEHL